MNHQPDPPPSTILKGRVQGSHLEKLKDANDAESEIEADGAPDVGQDRLNCILGRVLDYHRRPRVVEHLELQEAAK